MKEKQKPGAEKRDFLDELFSERTVPGSTKEMRKKQNEKGGGQTKVGSCSNVGTRGSSPRQNPPGFNHRPKNRKPSQNIL